MNHGRGLGVAGRRGRPARIVGEVASERIWAWLTVAERAALDTLSKESGTPVAVMIRDAVNEYVGDFTEHRVFSVTGNSPRPAS